jgi:hypothetical protein
MKIIIAIALALMVTGCASFIEKNACLFPGDETGYSRTCTSVGRWARSDLDSLQKTQKSPAMAPGFFA